jgi:uncharacterized membrane protein
MSLYDRRAYSVQHLAPLSFAERAISIAAGLGLAAVGARPRPNTALSILALAAGSYLAWRGATGRDPIRSVLGDSPT